MIVTLTTDFGPGDYVAAMKGVILSIDPKALVVDLDHTVRPQNIRQGAYSLYAAAPFFPFAIHVGVVDPGVGTERRPVAFVCKGGIFVGPDNGLLVPAAEQAGIQQVRVLSNRAYLRERVSDTFHGRDVFAPVAGHLSRGLAPGKLGPIVKDFARLTFGTPKATARQVRGTVLVADRFGNVITNIPRPTMEKRVSFGSTLRVELGGYELELSLVPTYGHAQRGEMLATFSASGFLEIAVREGRAADQLSATPDTPVTVTFP